MRSRRILRRLPGVPPENTAIGQLRSSFLQKEKREKRTVTSEHQQGANEKR